VSNGQDLPGQVPVHHQGPRRLGVDLCVVDLPLELVVWDWVLHAGEAFGDGKELQGGLTMFLSRPALFQTLGRTGIIEIHLQQAPEKI
jgi:hypothetical protein